MGLNLYVKLALLAWVMLNLFKGIAFANERAPISVKPFYNWQVELSPETKAVVGPIEYLRSLKVRVDSQAAKIPGIDEIAPSSLPTSGENPESVKICLVEGRCLSLELPKAGEVLEHAPELDFSELLNGAGGKAYLTVSRENPSQGRDVNLSLKVETDQTFQLPQFDVLPETGLEPANPKEESGSSGKRTR